MNAPLSPEEFDEIRASVARAPHPAPGTWAEGLRKLIGEVDRLHLLLNAQPAALSEAQIEALSDAGNGALSDFYHDRACACREYPEGCVTDPRYRKAFGNWDTGAFGIGMAAVIGLWESMRVATGGGERS
ncbi:hypothetical protein ACIP9H_40265 [Streptomyces sp. NPDC088732]|uniref:hypothetical protein n=1 Tax=Streptomyces sp. NPDC088732 TaxID=3365879 RepID=UPI0037F733D2